MSDLLDRIAQVLERASALEERMADPAVATSPGELAKLGKELGRLRPVVETGRRYREAVVRLQEAREMLADDDPELRLLAQAEVDEQRDRREALAQELQNLLLPKDPADEKDAILEIRAGTGGEEAALFAADLFRMYERFAEANGWKLEILESSSTDSGGFKELIAGVRGADAYGRLKYEKGVHRVQRVPATESQGRIHTSTCTVAILPEAEELDVEINPQDLRIDVFRSSGPGGQSVNTTDSAVRITHLPSGVVVTCQDEKSQHKNKAKAMKVLRSRILEAELERQAAERAGERRSQVGSGERSEKIRTYNYPQNRVTDHRAGLTFHQLDRMMEGEIGGLLDGVAAFMRAAREPALARAAGAKPEAAA